MHNYKTSLYYNLLHHYHFIIFFFFNDTATTEIYTLSLHDALPICLYDLGCGDLHRRVHVAALAHPFIVVNLAEVAHAGIDRKSTRLNSSHSQISYAVFCLKKKKNIDVIMVHVS